MCNTDIWSKLKLKLRTESNKMRLFHRHFLQQFHCCQNSNSPGPTYSSTTVSGLQEGRHCFLLPPTTLAGNMDIDVCNQSVITNSGGNCLHISVRSEQSPESSVVAMTDHIIIGHSHCLHIGMCYFRVV